MSVCLCVSVCGGVWRLTGLRSAGIVLEDYVLYVRISICLSKIQQHPQRPESGRFLAIREGKRRDEDSSFFVCGAIQSKPFV